MKKLTIFVLSIALMLCCAFTLTACEDNNTDNKVTEEEWIQIMNDITQFTASGTANGTNTIIKVDGSKVSVTTGQTENIYVIDGNNYFVYVKNGDEEWIRFDSDFYNYQNIAQPQIDTFKVLANDYKAFKYSKGCYKANKLDKMDTVNVILKNVVATFENGRLIAFSLEITSGQEKGHLEITDIGNTSIDLPTNYHIS